MRPKIYYLDDETDLVDLFQDLFSCSDYELKTFSSPKELVEVSKLEPADLYILDYRLPGTNGFEVAKLLPEGSKKVLITGELHVEIPNEFMCRLEKPFETEHIQQFIDKFVQSFAN